MLLLEQRVCRLPVCHPVSEDGPLWDDLPVCHLWDDLPVCHRWDGLPDDHQQVFLLDEVLACHQFAGLDEVLVCHQFADPDGALACPRFAGLGEVLACHRFAGLDEVPACRRFADLDEVPAGHQFADPVSAAGLLPDGLFPPERGFLPVYGQRAPAWERFCSPNPGALPVFP